MRNTRHSDWLLKECRALLAAAPRGPEQLRDYQVKAGAVHVGDAQVGAVYRYGAGQNGVVLTVLDHLFTHGQAERALIVAPLRVAIQTWPTELARVAAHALDALHADPGQTR
jgi:hypothetical protein